MNAIKNIFIRGLITLAPIVVTIAIVVWLFDFIESIFKHLMAEFIGLKYYFPGEGIVVALILIFIVGVLINHWLIQKIYGCFEKLLHKMPLIKTLYRSITDLVSFFKSDGAIAKKSFVAVVNLNGFKILGLVSRQTFEDLPKGIGEEGVDLAVFIPFSYQIGGATIIVKKEQVTPIEMGVEQGLRFSATAGMPGGQRK